MADQWIEDVIEESDVINGVNAIEQPSSIGRTDDMVRVVCPEQTFYLKKYKETHPPYSGRFEKKDVLKQIDCSSRTHTWGGAEHEYRALQSLAGLELGNFDAPEPVELFPDYHAFVMTEVPVDIHLHEELFPYPAPSKNRRLVHSPETAFGVMDSLVDALLAMQTATASETRADMAEYVETHVRMVSESSLPSRFVTVLENVHTHAELSFPVVQVHGEFGLRNLAYRWDTGPGVFDWNLSISSHPLIDLHELISNLERWSYFPFSPSRLYRTLAEYLKQQYLLKNPFDIDLFDFLCTRFTSLVRTYWNFVDNSTGLRRYWDLKKTKPALLDELSTVAKLLEGATESRTVHTEPSKRPSHQYHSRYEPG